MDCYVALGTFSVNLAPVQPPDREGAHLGVVVCKDPGKHGVLHEVAVGPSRQGVQVHEVLKVADLSPLPGRENKESWLSCRAASQKNGPISYLVC